MTQQRIRLTDRAANGFPAVRISAISAAPAIDEPKQRRIIVPGQPMGKPRWRKGEASKRPAVQRYWDYAASIRAAAGRTTKFKTAPIRVDVSAWFEMPASWSAKKKSEMQAQPHQQKPDRDNVDKGVLDALFDDDSAVALGFIQKFWDDGKGARTEITLFFEGNE